MKYGIFDKRKIYIILYYAHHLHCATNDPLYNNIPFILAGNLHGGNSD